MKKYILILSILFSTVSCTNNSLVKDNVKSSNNSLVVETSPNTYSPVMSSTVGILIKPIFEESKNTKVVIKTDNGILLSWDQQVKQLGKEATYNKNNIYWSYNPDEKINNSEVRVSLIKIDSNEIIKETIIKINIDEKGLASVSNNNNDNSSKNTINTTTSTQKEQKQESTQIAFKGYEVYTWKENNIQFFSILLGTNRNKTIDEIKNSKIDFETLLSKISNFAKGETIIVFDNSIFESSQRVELDDEMKKKLKDLCDSKGINISF